MEFHFRDFTGFACMAILKRVQNTGIGWFLHRVRQANPNTVIESFKSRLRDKN